MSKRFIIAALGVLLSAVFASSASADHVGFTINGNPNGYTCTAPCSIEVYDPDGGSYQWDFHANDGSFDVQATGNPVSWTYPNVGSYVITQYDGVSSADGFVKVIPKEDSAPEDIELVSPASGPVPRVLEFTTSRKEMDFFCTVGHCEMEFVKRSGPDGSGLYHHFLRLDDGRQSFELDVEAYNTGPAYAVRDEFTITVTGQTELFKERKASWKLVRKGSRCVVNFAQKFKTTFDYTARLKLVAKESNLRVGKTVRKIGGEGRSRIRGKLKLSPSEVEQLPVKAKARLKVVVAGKAFVARDARKIPAGCG